MRRSLESMLDDSEPALMMKAEEEGKSKSGKLATVRVAFIVRCRA